MLRDIDATTEPYPIKTAHVLEEAIGAGGSLATILQFERFRIDVSDSAFTGRTP